MGRPSPPDHDHGISQPRRDPGHLLLSCRLSCSSHWARRPRSCQPPRATCTAASPRHRSRGPGLRRGVPSEAPARPQGLLPPGAGLPLTLVKPPAVGSDALVLEFLVSVSLRMRVGLWGGHGIGSGHRGMGGSFQSSHTSEPQITAATLVTQQATVTQQPGAQPLPPDGGHVRGTGPAARVVDTARHRLGPAEKVLESECHPHQVTATGSERCLRKPDLQERCARTAPAPSG